MLARHFCKLVLVRKYKSIDQHFWSSMWASSLRRVGGSNARILRVPRAAAGVITFCRPLCMPPPRPAINRPSEATVKRLAEEAKIQQRMWDAFVPEQGIRFGDKCVPAELSHTVISASHAARNSNHAAP